MPCLARAIQSLLAATQLGLVLLDGREVEEPLCLGHAGTAVDPQVALPLASGMTCMPTLVVSSAVGAVPAMKTS